MRAQFNAALHRADALEETLRERESLSVQARAHAESLENAAAQLRSQLTAVESAHRQERARWQDQHATAEAHWLRETDRARQAQREGERERKALLDQMKQLTTDRDQVRLDLTEARGALRALEGLGTADRAAPVPAAARAKAKVSRPRKRSRGASKHTR
jgi:hypothetical protein